MMQIETQNVGSYRQVPTFQRLRPVRHGRVVQVKDPGDPGVAVTRQRSLTAGNPMATPATGLNTVR